MYLPKPSRPGVSRTALGILAYCACLTRNPALSRGFYDPFAEPLFRAAAKDGPAIMDAVKTWDDVRPQITGPTNEPMRILTHVLWRKRFMQEHTLTGIARGAAQVVSLGSGMDTLALRLGPTHPGVTFFEVDQPDTIAAKRELVAKVFGTPPNVRYTATDFARQTAEETLLAEGYDPTAPTVFIAEFSLEYVPPPEVAKTWAFIRANAHPDSRFLTTWINRDKFAAKPKLAPTINAVADAGEPWLFTPTEAELHFLRAKTEFGIEDYLDGDRLVDERLGAYGVDLADLPYPPDSLRKSSLSFLCLSPA